PQPVEPVAGFAPSPTSGCSPTVKDSLLRLHAALQNNTGRFKKGHYRSVAMRHARQFDAASASTMPAPNDWRLPIAWAVSFSHDRVSPGVHSGWMLRT